MRQSNTVARLVATSIDVATCISRRDTSRSNSHAAQCGKLYSQVRENRSLSVKLVHTIVAVDSSDLFTEAQYSVRISMLELLFT
jgi:hypothetical protein